MVALRGNSTETWEHNSDFLEVKSEVLEPRKGPGKEGRFRSESKLWVWHRAQLIGSKEKTMEMPTLFASFLCIHLSFDYCKVSKR